MSAITVKRNDGNQRYEAWSGEECAGFVEYLLKPGIIVFTYTEVDPRFQGMGVASSLCRQALDDVRAEGMRRVQPRCPFVSSWIRRNPEYADLLP